MTTATTTATSAASTTPLSTSTENGWSAADAVLVGASFVISLMLGAFAAQVLMDSPFISGASKQPIVVAIH